MSPDKQRIAIAEACGWKPKTYGPDWHQSETKMPDYCRDLNAMHAAEKVLTTAGEWCKYVDELSKIKSAEDWREYGTDAFLLIRATAAQRAEAFLRTLDKWEGEQ